MKTIILVALIAFVVAKEDYYVLDKIDTNALLTDVKELKTFLNCLNDKAPCKKEHQSYRDNAAEAMRQACKRCTSEQKLFTLKFLAVVPTKLPKQFQDFKNKYDPDHKYFGVFEAIANNLQASIL